MLQDAPDKVKLTQSQIRDAVATFLGAASETTAVALAWTWYLIAANPEVELKLKDELRINLAGRASTFRELPELRYTTMVVQEALRIFPPAWMMLRTAVDADEIGGFRIPRGGTILMSPFLTQRRGRHLGRSNLLRPGTIRTWALAGTPGVLVLSFRRRSATVPRRRFCDGRDSFDRRHRVATLPT